MKTIKLLYPARDQDQYQSEALKEAMIHTFYPSNDTELIQGLSQVTAAFYGFLLDKSRQLHGTDSVDRLSRELFYELGKLKTWQAQQKMADLPLDTRAIAMVLISAIFSASPEYNFSIHEFSPEYTLLELSGVDRYYRICTSLGITHLVTWPVLIPFMQAVIDTLGLHCHIRAELKQLRPNGETRCLYHFKAYLDTVNSFQ